MYCSKCGKEIKEGAQFCGGCGAPVGMQNMQPKITASNTDKQRITQTMKRMVITAVVVLVIGGVTALILNITKKYPVQLVVYDVISETPLTDGVELSFYQGEEDGYRKTPTKTTQTGENGQAEIKLREGIYMVEASLPGYQTAYLEVEAKEDGAVYSQYLVPEIPEGQCMVLLKWDGEGTDLDLTIFTPNDTDYGEKEHVGGKFLSDDYGNYILSDNQSGYEVAYIDTSVNGDYRIYVNDYTDSQAGEYDSTRMSETNARVFLFDHTGLQVAYALPAREKGVVWEVAEVNGSDVTENGNVYTEMEGKRWWLVDKYEKWLVKKNSRHIRDDGIPSKWTEYSYDSAGNRIQEVSYRLPFENEELLTEEAVTISGAWKFEWEYDDAGNMTRETEFYFSDATVHKTNDIYIREYSYDDEGNQILELRYTNGELINRYEWEYDNEGKKTKETNFYYEKSSTSTYEYIYDSEGNLIKSVHSSGATKEYSYDSAGNMTKEVHYRSDGGMSYHREWEYDECGNQVKDIKYDVHDGSITNLWEWEYDSEGYITKEVHYTLPSYEELQAEPNQWVEYIYE